MRRIANGWIERFQTRLAIGPSPVKITRNLS